MAAASEWRTITRWRAVALGAVLAVLFIIAGALFLHHAHKTVRLDTFEDLASVGQIKEEAIEAWRGERLNSAANLAQGSFFARAVATLMETSATTGAGHEIEERLDLARRHDYDTSAFVATPNGHVIASAGAPVAVDAATLAEIKEAVQNGHPLLGDIFKPGGTLPVAIDTVAPIAGAKPPVVLVMRADPSLYLFPLIQRWPVHSATAETLLVERRGDDVVFLNTLRLRPEAALAVRQPLSQTTLPTTQAVLGHTGPFEGLDYRGVPVLTDVRAVRGSPWFLVAKVDKAEILADFHREMAVVLLTILGLVLLVVFSIGYIYKAQGKDAYKRLYTVEREAKAALEASERRFALFMRHLPGVAVIRDLEGRYVYMNEAWESATGLRREDYIGKTPFDCFPREEAERLIARDRRAAESGEAHVTEEVELQHVIEPGWRLQTRFMLEGGEGKPPLIAILSLNLTERKQAEEKLLRLSRFYLVLSELNRSMVHQRDRKALLQETCKILVEHGGFKMAWIGFKDEAAGRIVPEASAGFEKGYLEGLVIRWDGSPDGQGPVGRAIREKQSVIFEDCLNDPSYAPWRGAALERGYRASCAFPIRQRDDVTGVFMVYHAEAGAIGEEESRLLERLAEDLGFALTAIQDRSQCDLAEEALRTSEDSYRDLVENASDLICTHDLDGILLSVNAAIARALGFAAGDLVGRNIRGLLPREQREGFDAYLQTIRLDKEAVGVMQIANRAGEVRYLEYRNSLRAEGVPQPLVRSMARDITDAVLARRALQASEEKYRAVLKNMEESYYEVDIAGNLTFFNDALCGLFGYTRDELMGMNNRQYTDAENAKKLYQAFNAVYRTGEPTRGFDWEITRKDGAIRTIEASVSLRKDASGKPLGFRGVIRDVTEEKRTQEALRESEARYRAIFEGVAEGIYISTPEGRPVLANPALMKMLGYESMEEMLKRDIEKEGYPDPSERRRFQEIIERDGIIHGFETEWRRVDGSMIHVIENARAIRDGEGRVVAYEGTVRDVTERKRAEQALKESEETFRHFFEGNPAASYLEAAGRQLIHCNQAFLDLFGFKSEEEAIKTPAEEQWLDPEERPRFFERLARDKRMELLESTYKRRDGSLVHVIETVTGLFDQEGKLSGALGFLIDVTEQKALESQLRQAQKMEAVGQLAAGVAHDFNNVLMAIQGASELLAKMIARSQPGHKEVVTIQKATDRAALLTRQLLGFARKTVLEPVPLDPKNLVDGLLPMVKRLLPETIRVEFIAAREVGFVHADQGQIEQVLMNLCVNARDAMSRGGTLTIEIENVLINGAYIETHPWAKPGRHVLISVTDTGIGMKPEVISKVFDPFFTTKPQGKGTGLGLSMAYGIVKQHDGMINVYSELGVGTTFKVYLPMVERRATTVGTKVTRAVTGGHETILLVEDDKEVRDVVVEVLMSLGYKVLSAGDGAEGLAVLRRSDGVDLVISDIVMPKMSGKDLRVATQQIYPSLRFLFTSGYTENAVHHDFILDKGVSFLSKPYGIDVLARKVREILDRKGEEGG